MGEHVPHARRQWRSRPPSPAPASVSAAAIDAASSSHGVDGSSIMPAEQTLHRAAGGTARHRPRAPAGRPWQTVAARRAAPPCAGSVSGSPRPAAWHQAPPWAGEAGRPPRRADQGAQLHQCLREIAGTVAGGEPLGRGPQSAAGGRQRRLHRQQPAEHPLDIGVDRHRRLPAGDRRRPRPPCRRRCPAAP